MLRLDDDRLPRPLGRYLLVERLGRGGMGDVFRAHRADDGGAASMCVVKTIRADRTADDEVVSRFSDEARLAAKLTHPNVGRVLDCGYVDDSLYLAMELIDGPSVRDLLDELERRGRVLEEAAALHLMAEVLDALDYAHRARDPETGKPLDLVHRDVSPHNVLVTSSGAVKLIDFGLAASAIKVTQTLAARALGKLKYAAPEQAKGGSVTAAADQFSAAIVAYELVSGRRFYPDLDDLSLWRLASQGGFRPSDFGRLDEELRAAIERSLQVDPRARFSDCGEARDVFRHILIRRHGDVGRQRLAAAVQHLSVTSAPSPTVSMSSEEHRVIESHSGPGSEAPTVSFSGGEHAVIESHSGPSSPAATVSFTSGEHELIERNSGPSRAAPPLATSSETESALPAVPPPPPTVEERNDEPADTLMLDAGFSGEVRDDLDAWPPKSGLQRPLLVALAAAAPVAAVVAALAFHALVGREGSTEVEAVVVPAAAEASARSVAASHEHSPAPPPAARPRAASITASAPETTSSPSSAPSSAMPPEPSVRQRRELTRLGRELSRCEEPCADLLAPKLRAEELRSVPSRKLASVVASARICAQRCAR